MVRLPGICRDRCRVPYVDGFRMQRETSGEDRASVEALFGLALRAGAVRSHDNDEMLLVNVTGRSLWLRRSHVSAFNS